MSRGQTIGDPGAVDCAAPVVAPRAVAASRSPVGLVGVSSSGLLGVALSDIESLQQWQRHLGVVLGDRPRKNDQNSSMSRKQERLATLFHDKKPARTHGSV